jgi:hypothetical protein
MAPPRATGFSRADAADDFLRARRHQTLSRLARLLSRQGDVDVILPFDEVVEALGRIGERDLGLQVVELDSILGTVDRTHGFDRQFRPTSPAVRARWEKIADLARRGEPLPPVELYRVGEVHFVRDGHHRVSVARALGRTEISAHVVEVVTRVGAERSLTIADLPVKSHERLFRERVPLFAEAARRVRLSNAMSYGQLAEGVEAWGYRRALTTGELLDREQNARRWYEEEFVPVVETLREADLLGNGTEADAYLRAGRERWRLLRTHAWNDAVVDRLRGERRRRS